ncbi:fascin domain-containing protein [Microcystis aeruginosa]|nr:hypothetical protein [Microcystis aeruginosa]
MTAFLVKGNKMTTSSTTGNSIRVAFKANNGKYITSNSDGNVLQASSDAIGSNENFQMYLQGEDRVVALMASNGKYVSNQQDGAVPLAAIADAISPTEQFTVEDWDPKIVVLFAANKKYIQLVDPTAALQAQGSPADAATFEIVLLSESSTPVETRLSAETPPTASPSPRAATPLSATPPSAFTVCFCGTACTRDEGEVSRDGSDKNIYAPATGYIPVRIHKEITGDLRATTPSVTVRGVGENDWAVPRDNSEPLVFNAPLNADPSLLSYVQSYSGGNQYSVPTQLDGWSAPALALHGANLAAASGKNIYNFIGHSRGAMEAIMAAWFIYFYGPDDVKHIPINIFAIDPVPGTGEWWGIFTQLPPNVVNYVGIYAWDMCVQPIDKPFMGLVPRPNGLMTGKLNEATIYNSWWPNKWKYIADNYVLTDPLKVGTEPQPTNYELYACRGRHSTVAGNYTADGKYDAANVSETVAPVPELVYKMARGYLTQWGTTFQTASASQQRVLALRKSINTFHRDFDIMGGGGTRTSALTARPYVRRLSSISGLNPFNSYYMDNVVGDPPYKMVYPVTSERTDAGWVKWNFL